MLFAGRWGRDGSGRGWCTIHLVLMRESCRVMRSLLVGKWMQNWDLWWLVASKEGSVRVRGLGFVGWGLVSSF